MTTRQKALQEAQTWLGTPYHHHGRVKGAGVDCGQLLIGVFGAVGVIEPRPIDYACDWHLHHSEEQFIEFIKSFGGFRIETPPQPGDIGIYRFGRCFSHGSIVLNDQEVIHSYIGLGVVVNNVADYPLADRLVQYWSLPFKDE